MIDLFTLFYFEQKYAGGFLILILSYLKTEDISGQPGSRHCEPVTTL
jgi:hypothetical protein